MVYTFKSENLQNKQGWQIGSFAESASLFNHPNTFTCKLVCSFNLTVSV